MTGKLKKAGLAAALLAMAMGGAGWWYRAATLPQLDGTVKAPGLSAAVDVVRDAEGIPHIYAGAAEDAWHALG